MQVEDVYVYFHLLCLECGHEIDHDDADAMSVEEATRNAETIKCPACGAE